MEDHNTPGDPAGAPPEPAAWTQPHPTRREFLSGALAATGLAMAGMLDVEAAFASATGASADPLRGIGEIVRNSDGKLRGAITILNGERVFPNGTTPQQVRYLQGTDAAGRVVWPPRDGTGPNPALPGPTLRARVGDEVELTFLNHVDVSDFGNTLDRVERGMDAGCQRVVSADGTELYPGGVGDTPPNCFHGSSTSNIHFHGTHVTPDGLGDNVLLQLRPNPAVTAESVKDDFEKIFAARPQQSWSDLPASWRERQLALLRQYDETTPWQGRNPTPGNPVLPPDRQLLPPTVRRIEQGLWPQYQVGAYPYHFKLTQQGGSNGPVMGQAPGTHWYHAHKHGSTAINVYNGMAGAFIIEGDYDDALKRLYPGLVQQVLLVQNLAEAPALLRGGSAPQNLYVNGQANPTITMRPGEVQLWRLINASVRSVTTLIGFGGGSGDAPEMRQIAQDGVQLTWDNFRDQPRLAGMPEDPARANAFAAGNRIDLLVKAPARGGTWSFQVQDTTRGRPRPQPILALRVAGSPVSMDFPTQDTYPAFPSFLSDIHDYEVRITRKLEFGWEPGRSGPGLGANGHAPQFSIDGEQFQGDRYDQTMVLGDVEEWTLTNTTSRIAHPFHIHVNPFQVVEIYDPATRRSYAPERNFFWHDVIAIPPSILDSQGRVVGRPGTVRIRHRFVDFTGSYVLHCHMLAHEDRGMMQLVRVVSPEVDVPHH